MQKIDKSLTYLSEVSRKMDAFNARTRTLENNVTTGVQYNQELIKKIDKMPTEVQVKSNFAKWLTIAGLSSIFILGALTTYFALWQYKPSVEEKNAYRDALKFKQEVSPAILDIANKAEKQMPKTYKKWVIENKEAIDWYNEWNRR